MEADDRAGLVAECAERRKRAVATAAARGLGGLVIWSRGGHTRDRYADVFYLANHYQMLSHVTDYPPRVVSPSHCALVMPVDGEPALLLPADNWRPDQVAVTDVRVRGDLPGLVAETMREKGMADARIGLVGTDVMSLQSHRNLLAAVPGLQLEPADDILRRLRLIKSPRELQAVRRSGALAARAMETLLRRAVQGATEAEAVAAAASEVISGGGAVYGYALGSGPWGRLFAATPFAGYDSRRALCAGDMLHADSVTTLDGYYSDFTRSTVIGGTATSAQRDVLETAMGSVDAVIAAVRPGIRAQELAATGDRYLREAGAASKGYTEMGSLWGHSIGLTWESPWLHTDDETVIQEGMVLAIEQGVSHPDVGFAVYEDDVIVTATGAEVVTPTPKVWWQ